MNGMIIYTRIIVSEREVFAKIIILKANNSVYYYTSRNWILWDVLITADLTIAKNTSCMKY